MSQDTKAVPLAVVGIGCVFPKAKTLREYWANVKNKVDAIRDVPESHWNRDDYFDQDPKKPDHVYAYKGGFLDAYDFDPSEFGLAPNTLEATDPAQLFGLVAAKMALADAGCGVDKDHWDRSRVSVILGVTGALELVVPLGARLGHPRWRKALAEAGVPADVAEDVCARIADSYVPWQENSFPGLLGNVVAGRIANRFNLGGTNCAVDAACGSSLSAAHMACLELQAGRCDMAITGGVDTFNDIFMYTCFTKTPALSASGHSRPFDAKADGTTLGEGVGMVVLKRLTDAEKAGDRIYAVIRGIGTSSDGRGKSIYAPSADGQTRALKEAYRVSGVTPDTVELVEAHGTGTAVGDGIEVEALSQVYKGAKREGVWCALGSVKSQIGHTKAAAGSAALVKAALALHHKVFPPTIKVEEPLPILAKGDSPFYLSLEKRPWLSPAGHPRRAACSALGFGGTNFHAVLEEHDARKASVDWDPDVELFAVSGKDAGELTGKLNSFAVLKSWDELRPAAVKSRADFDAQSSCRLVIVTEKSADFGALIAKAVLLLAQNAGKPSWSSPEGIYFGSGRSGKLGVLFPGQGAQYVGMGRDLFCQFPEAFTTLENADAAFAGAGRLSDALFPQPAWKPEQKDAQELALRSTDVAQPVLGAAAVGALKVLARFGVKADAYAGHSYGELVALHAAGRYDEKTLHELSGLRGRLMAAGKGDLGSMLAVQSALAEIEKIVAEERLELVIANRNAPAQNVLSGATAEIARAEKIFAARGHKCVRLPVAAAFHSPLVAPALAGLAAALKDVAFSAPTAPVYANTTAEPYPADAAASRDLLAGQLAKPVEFVKLIEAMHRDGVRTFLEVGAGARLTGLVGLTLKGRDFRAAAVDASNGRKSGAADLARALAQLAASGHAVDLTPWQDGAAGLKDARPKPKMAVTLTGAPYRSSKPAPRPVRAPLTAAAPAAVSSAPLPVSVSANSALPLALAAAQAGIDALTRLQEQAAQLHLQFLQGQETAQRSVQALIEQQQALSAQFSGAPAAVTSSAFVAPAPVVTAPLTAPAPAPVARAAALAAPATNIATVLVAIVSEKTGYPAETINPDMDLEGDLGIDSIKRVEIFSAVQEKLPGAPKVKPEHLGTLRTLKSIADYLAQGMAAAPAPVAVAASVAAVASASSAAPILPTLISIVSEKTGYPAETINTDMDLEGDLGIDSIKRVEILSAVQEKLPGAPKVKPEHLGTLRTLKSIADYLAQGMAVAPAPAAVSTPAPAPAAILKELQRLMPELAPVGPRDLLALDKSCVVAISRDSGLDEALAREWRAKGFQTQIVSIDEPQALPVDLGALVLVAPTRPAGLGCPWTAPSEAWLKKAFQLAQAAGRRFDARDGRGLLAAVTRLDGALGFEGRDFDPAFGGIAGLVKTAAREWPRVTARAVDVDPALPLDAAAALLAKELLFDGPVETALNASGARGVALVERAVPAPTRRPLQPGDAVIVTGGARGVTAACALALAREFQPRLVLVGRSPAPGAEPAGLDSARTEAELRAALAAREKGLSPKVIGEKAKRVLAEREIRATLSALAALGVEARYRACDARDADAVRALVAETARDFGPVRGLIHGAGVLADKRIAEKTPQAVDAVLDTKLAGLRHFLDALDPEALRLIALFSSSTAHYGRVGQSDYAIANEALNKAAQVLARRSKARVVAPGWGPWDGGMVDASLRALFASEGVGVIDLEAGAAHLVAESLADGPAQSVVLARRGGAAPALPLAFERDLTLESLTILSAHALNGRAVLPLALSAEWLAHAAQLSHPGLAFAGFEDLRALKGVFVRPGAATPLKAYAGALEKRDGGFAVAAELRGEGGVLHAAAKIILAPRLAAAPAPALSVAGPAYARGLDAAYRDVLFHGAEMRFITGVSACGEDGIVVDARTAPPPSAWSPQPLRERWSADPAALDAAFQAMILWSVERLGAPCLPSRMGRYRQFAARFPQGIVRVVVRTARRADGLAAADVEFVDERGALIARLDGGEFTVDASLAGAFRRNAVESAA